LQNTKPVKPPSNHAQCPADIARISRLNPIPKIPMRIHLNSQEKKILIFQPLSVAVTAKTPIPVNINKKWKSSQQMVPAMKIRQ
jgi:hypothetical protein